MGGRHAAARTPTDHNSLSSSGPVFPTVGTAVRTNNNEQPRIFANLRKRRFVAERWYEVAAILLVRESTGEGFSSTKLGSRSLALPRTRRKKRRKNSSSDTRTRVTYPRP